MDQLSDEQLLQRAGDGDAAAFTELVRRHHRALIQFAYRLLGGRDMHAAEDLAQHVFLEAWKRAADFEPRAKVTTWLFRIATNACLNRRRYLRPRIAAPLDADIASPAADGPANVVGEEASHSVRTAIAALPDQQRAVIVLRHYHDLSYAQIAEIIGSSPAAVDSMLHRARAALRDQLENTRKNENFPQDSSPRRAEYK
jgi:RNA polymerase sigma-70 factor (ECF subfamily)